jgi:hypothetical protein
MNAKKISTLLLCSAGIAMLAACSGKTVTRTDAETNLDAMNTTVTASGYVMPTSWDAKRTTKTTAGSDYTETHSYKYVSASEIYVAASNSGTLVVSSVSSKSSQSYVATLKDGKIMLAANDDTIRYASTTSATGTSVAELAAKAAWDLVVAAASAQSAIITSTPAHMSQYLKAFATGTGSSAVNAGATIGNTTYMKSESYKSSGTGNLEMNITPNYTKDTYSYDEPMTYKFTSSQVVEMKNDLKGTDETFAWGKYNGASFSATGLTDVSTDAIKIAAIGAAITLGVATIK